MSSAKSAASASKSPSPSAPALGITSPKGFRAAGLHCGVKADPARNDLTLIACETDAAAAAVFTRNRMCAAPVNVSREFLAASGGRARVIVANSGNANAATGERGREDAVHMAAVASREVILGHADAGEDRHRTKVLVCSTGIIGVPLPIKKIEEGIKAAAAKLAAGPEADEAASRGIMTTDAYPKRSAAQARIGGKVVTVAGIAKGAGMIAPNMATMLAFLTTDAAVAPRLLQSALRSAVDASFNTIRVDGHTSTNDTVLCLASGLSGAPELKKDTPDFGKFRKLLDKVCLDLALMIVRDGEGAAKLCEIRVEGAASDKEARAIAVSLADSPLWKCAMNAGHANWGRVVCAVGNVISAGGPEDLTVRLGKHKVYAKGKPVPADEADLKAAMKEDPISVRITLTHGEGEALIRTCDVAHPYITENTGAST
jgi:glutamate N-acetyltransferase/amino-acid N-acetyltransferase